MGARREGVGVGVGVSYAHAAAAHDCLAPYTRKGENVSKTNETTGRLSSAATMMPDAARIAAYAAELNNAQAAVLLGIFAARKATQEAGA